MKRTAFDACYGNNGVQRMLGIRDEDALTRAVANAPAADVVLVLVNDPRPGGSGGFGAGLPTSVCSIEATAFQTAIHELGHSMAHLGDEYVDDEAARSYAMPGPGEDLDYPNLTVRKLVDFGSRESIRRTEEDHADEGRGSAPARADSRVPVERRVCDGVLRSPRAGEADVLRVAPHDGNAFADGARPELAEPET